MSSVGADEVRRRVFDVIDLKGLKLTAVAAAIGGSQNTLSGWKAGKAPDADALSRLPAALGVSGHWLLTGEGQMSAPGEKEVAPYEQARIEVGAAVRRTVLTAVEAALAPTSEAEGGVVRKIHEDVKAGAGKVSQRPGAAPRSKAPASKKR